MKSEYGTKETRLTLERKSRGFTCHISLSRCLSPIEINLIRSRCHTGITFGPIVRTFGKALTKQSNKAYRLSQAERQKLLLEEMPTIVARSICRYCRQRARP